MFNRRILLIAALLYCGAATFSWAAEPATRIDVKGMHCVMCGKKISTKVQSLPGVAAAVIDVKAGTLTVTGKTGAAISPKTLWETVEAAGYKPTKLVGPAGNFDAKPKK